MVCPNLRLDYRKQFCRHLKFNEQESLLQELALVNYSLRHQTPSRHNKKTGTEFFIAWKYILARVSIDALLYNYPGIAIFRPPFHIHV